MSPRRPLSLLQSLLLSLFLLVGTWACDRVSVSTSKDDHAPQGHGSVEAERTSEMEDKAAEIERQAENLKSMEGSDQDKIDAYNKLQQSQQELNSMSEGSEGGN
jgi:hypothetical protein